MLNDLNKRNIYRGPASSKEFNERNKQLRHSIAEMYNLLNENESNIEKNMDIVLRENFFLSYEIYNLSRELEKYKSLLTEDRDGLNNEYAKQVHVQNFYTTQGLSHANEDRKVSIHKEYGVAMPTSTDMISRFGYHTDTGEVFVPNSLEIHLKEGRDTHRDEFNDIIYQDIQTTNTNNIIDKNKNTFWTRTVTYPVHEAVHEIFGEIHIIIPTEGFQNIYTNTLKIVPYPEGSMRLHDIEYKGYNNQWRKLETYPTAGDSPKTINNIKKTLFQFPETEMIELKIKFSQPYWFENEGQAHFTYGFKDISLEYHSYSEQSSEVITTVSLQDQDTYFHKVLEPIAIPAVGANQDITDTVSFELYYDKDLTTQFSFGSTILAQVNEVYIKTIFTKNGNNIPVLKELQIPYLYKD